MIQIAPARKHARLPSVALRPEEVDFPIRVVRCEGSAHHVDGFHTHQFFVLFFAEKGSGELRLANDVVTLNPGHAHLVFPGEPHDPSGLKRMRGWLIEFTSDVVSIDGATGYFGSLFGSSRWVRCLRKHSPRARCVQLEPARRKLVSESIARIADELAHKPIAHREVVRAELQLLLIQITRHLAPNAISQQRSPVVEEALAYIDAHYTGSLSLAQVARAVGRSPAYLTDAVRTQTGLTVVEWIAERRMEEARMRLRDTDEDVSIIAERLGYGSTNHFIRQFRRAHGTTPGAWRRI